MTPIYPTCFLVAETKVNAVDLEAFLAHKGVPGWTTDAASHAEMLAEVCGKLCYQSFDTSLNKNLTKTGGRNNLEYLQNGIIGTRHGSVLEHPTATIIMCDVSRVVTHEIVRHRAGTAFSQTSGRYVRVDNIKAYIPSDIAANATLTELFKRAFEFAENTVRDMEQISGIDKLDFGMKKKLTSAFRRVIGNGQANDIAVTANHRAWRHMIQTRTACDPIKGGAEEEIRAVFNQVFGLLEPRFPAIYADAEFEMVDGLRAISFTAEKV